MNEAQLKNLLFKVSVQAVYHLSDGSQDPISIEEALEHSFYKRPILNQVQVWGITSPSGYQAEIKFVLSPDYLASNQDLVLMFGLHELAWAYKIPTYDYGNEDLVADDLDGTITIRSEEGVAEWLVRGEIELLNVCDRTYNVDLERLYHTLIHS